MNRLRTRLAASLPGHPSKLARVLLGLAVALLAAGPLTAGDAAAQLPPDETLEPAEPPVPDDDVDDIDDADEVVDPAVSPIVRGIEIQGLQRVDRASVRSKVYTQIGRPLNRARLSEDLKRVYRMNFFDDVQAAVRPHPDGGVVLVFRVDERPTIVDIRYRITGDALDLEAIQKVVDLRRFSILDEAGVRFNLDKIEELFVEEGHFLVESSYTLTPAPNNGVIVTLIVDEGRKVEVREVNIVGNQDLSTEEIKGVMATREGGFFSFLTQSGAFKREFFAQDIQRIQLLYLTRGYVQVSIADPVVTLSPARDAMSITIRVQEGPKYTVSAVDMRLVEEGQWLVPKERLMRLLELRPGETFSYTEMQADIQRVGDAFRDKGFANTTVTTEHNLDPDARTIALTYKIQVGEPVYFRRIIIHGNRNTQDEVIRRELRIAEGELYSASALRQSRQRVGVLGFFETVEIDPKPTDEPDKMDVQVFVREKQTGTFQVGAGFSSLESFILTAQIAKDNFLGRGQTLSAQLTLSGIRQLYSISFFEPYFLDSRWTFAFDLFNFQEEFVDFSRLRTGGNLSWGYRFTDALSLSLTYTLENVDANLRRAEIPIASLRQSGLTSSGRLTLSYDTRNNRLFPSDGQFSTVSFEHADDFLGSENQFSRFIGRTRWYFPLPYDSVFKVNTTVGYVVSGDDQSIPLFERFFVGGIYTIRGFQRNSIGQRLFTSSTPEGGLSGITIGGDKQLIFNAELEVPIFPEVGIRGVLFFDAGNAWGIEETLDPFQLRTAIGFGFRWHSPVGPLRFEWGIPLKPRSDEDPLVFEFTIGNSF